MRFIALFVAICGAATVASAGIMPRSPPGDLQVIGKGLCFIEKGLGVTSIEEFLDTELGGALRDLDNKLGVTAIEDALGILDCTPEKKLQGVAGQNSAIQIVGHGLCLVQKGLGITNLLDVLDDILGDALGTIQEALGISFLKQKLLLSGC